MDVPPIVTKCCETIEKYGLDQQGIYRIGGTHSKVMKLKERLDRGMSIRYRSAQERAPDGSEESRMPRSLRPDVAAHFSLMTSLIRHLQTSTR